MLAGIPDRLQVEVELELNASGMVIFVKEEFFGNFLRAEHLFSGCSICCGNSVIAQKITGCRMDVRTHAPSM
jgi:hypothetical protein